MFQLFHFLVTCFPHVTHHMPVCFNLKANPVWAKWVQTHHIHYVCA